MRARVLLRRAAELDLVAIDDWYDGQEEGLGSEFRGAVEEAISRVADNPRSYPALYRENRRVLIRRFPYVLWYRIQGNSAIVLACVHGRRNPRQVRTRLRKGV